MTQPIDWESFDPVTQAAHSLLREFQATRPADEIKAWEAVIRMEHPFQADLAFWHRALGGIGAAYRLVDDRVHAPKDIRDALAAFERDAGKAIWTGIIVVIETPRSRQWNRAVREANRTYTRVAQLAPRNIVEEPA